MANESDSQSPIFWDRLRALFTTRSDDVDDDRSSEHSGTAVAVCVLIALFLWLSFALQEERTVTLEFPTQITDLPEDEALTELPPATVRVQLEGESSRLLWLYLNPPTVDLEGGTETVAVSEALNLPTDVRALSVEPSEIALQKEPRLTRRVPVESRVQVRVASAYELLDDPHLNPDSIEVSGAQSLVEGIDQWPTDSMEITDVADSMAFEVPLQDTLDRLVDRSAEEVTLIAEAARFADAEREIPVEVTDAPSEDLVVLEPSTITVQYRVLFDDLFDSQRTDDFYATVAYEDIRRDVTGYVEPELQLPEEYTIRDPEITPTRLRYYLFVTGE